MAPRYPRDGPRRRQPRRSASTRSSRSTAWASGSLRPDLGFLGANGAGKTTTIRIVLDLLRADAGTTTWHGPTTTDLPRGRGATCPRSAACTGGWPCSISSCSSPACTGRGGPRDVREVARWLRHPRTTRRASDRGAEQGQPAEGPVHRRHRPRPEVLIMDEPFTGPRPGQRALLREAFLELRDRGRTVIFSTHQMEVAEALCESVAIVDRGRVVIGGPVRDVKRASGRQVVRISRRRRTTGRGWLAGVPGARLIRPADRAASSSKPRGRSGRTPRGPSSGATRRPVRDRRALARGDLHRAGRVHPATRTTRPRRSGRTGSHGRHGRRSGRSARRRDPACARTHGGVGVHNAGLIARREYLERVRRGRSWPRRAPGGLAVGVALIPLGVRLAGPRDRTRIGVVADEPALRRATIATLDSAPQHRRRGRRRRRRVRPFEQVDDAAAAAAVRRGGAGRRDARRARPDGGLDFRVLTHGALTPDRAQLLQFGAFGVGDPRLDGGPARRRRQTRSSSRVRGRRPDVGAADGPRPADRHRRDASRRIVGIVFVVLSFLTLVFYGMWVATGVVAEKASRVMELLITAATAPQLLIGKIVGIGWRADPVRCVLLPALVGLLSRGGSATCPRPGRGAAPSLAGLSPGLLAAFLVYFLLGFALYAAMYAGAGSLVSRAEDLQTSRCRCRSPRSWATSPRSWRCPAGRARSSGSPRTCRCGARS